MGTKTNPVCSKCGIELNDENWQPSYQKGHHCICKSCHTIQIQQWRKANPGKHAACMREWNHRTGRQRPMSENRECSSFLGVHIAEELLSSVFKNVERMPYCNPGYDFICGGGYKIDVKSACERKNRNGWMFNINHNIIANYFLCLAFDNRKDLNPLYIWLIPGGVVNHLTGATISPSTIHKWDEYKLDITKVTTCCNAMR